jgi:hypothetical protein
MKVYIVYEYRKNIYKGDFHRKVFLGVKSGFLTGRYIQPHDREKETPVDEELFVIIDEFPDYVVSSHGRVLNARGKEMTKSPTQHGDLTVGLMRDGEQHRRSIKTLVARAFVRQENEIFDTPILLDWDRGNLNWWNIAWRPRWFALMYIRQADEAESWWYAGPLRDTKHGGEYENILHAAMSTGSLVRDIRQGLMNHSPVFPTGAIFEFI